MNTTTVYKTRKERVIKITNKRTAAHYVLLDSGGRFIKELPADFNPAEYVKQIRGARK